MDATAVLSGVEMDQVSREPRYFATRLAMLRQAVADGVIVLRKIATSDNPAGIFTKPLVGAALRYIRGLALGLEPGSEPLEVRGNSPGKLDPGPIAAADEA